MSDILIQQDKSCAPQLSEMFEAIIKCIVWASVGQWDTVLFCFQCLDFLNEYNLELFAVYSCLKCETSLVVSAQDS